jgi:hypothetical protein
MATRKLNRLLKLFWCWSVNHRYEVNRQLSTYCYKLHCRRCDQYFAINHQERIILPWDQEFDGFYKELDEWKRRYEKTHKT